MFRRLKLLKYLQQINLSPEDTSALIRRLETDSCRAEDYEVLIRTVRAHMELSADLLAASPSGRAVFASASGKTQTDRAPNALGGAASRSRVLNNCWRAVSPLFEIPSPSLAAWGCPEVGSPMNRPDRITLSTKEGEAILARLAVYAPNRSDCEILAQVLRRYFWLMVSS